MTSANASAESLLIVISAPSGGGKTTLCEQVLATVPNTVRVVTCTTRPPRPGEQHGVDYYFLDPAEFASKVAVDDFLEHALVHGNRYGILKSEIIGKLREGNDVLLSVDVQGAATIRRQAGSMNEIQTALVTVFITPPSLNVLQERLKKRGQNSAADLERRLAAAAEEIAQWRHYDYLIVSTTVAEDLRRMQAIMLAEKMRKGRARLPGFDR